MNVGQKDTPAELVRHPAHRMGADFVVVIMDVLRLPPEQVAQVRR